MTSNSTYVAGLFEIGSYGVYLVQDVLHTYKAKLAQMCFNDGIVGQRDTLLVDLAIAAFVQKLTHCLQRWIAVANLRLDDLEHFRRSLGKLDKHSIVDL